MVIHRGLAALLLIAVLSGCQALGAADVPATLQAQNNAYRTEVVQLGERGAAERQSIQETAVADEAQAAILNSINSQLLATLETRITPTPPLSGEAGPDDSGLTVNLNPDAPSGQVAAVGSPGGSTPFVVTGISSSVRQADGCIEQVQTTFTPDASEIYATFVAYNLTSGTPMRAEWYQADQLMTESSWASDDDYEQLCVWFFIEPSDVAFTPGVWSVRLYANDGQIGSTLSFTIDG